MRVSLSEYFDKRIGKGNKRILLAKDDDIAIGVMTGKIDSPGAFINVKRIGKISHAFVEPDYRRKNVGKKMLLWYIAWFKKNGINMCISP